ncbi:hypothetical protein PPL_06132 [Heterostelium album PN500]|uniref:Peptidase S9 prolyl oligopeptidase catalytic domain-containing protein n=1 Tax=Heterostelium pallidum (strain ATCC 26659 / Pp 5 / PN500) TaxID=670386 RepID=D3BCA7_HETP5|nr:hypothetical protein PPL_06132 [Heterostelium album PN500]EFA80897.1 hypothetical protein PPL_06132 [Heterostelium album PN500]|eukprot:XP_020433016.1 hypothetical protein PPL_06132 [Heterostelium album PN500]
MKIYQNLLYNYIYLFFIIYIFNITAVLSEYRPYGSWYSPISANLSSTKFNVLTEAYPPTNDHAYWLERRPSEDGRSVLVEIDNFNNKRDLLPSGFGAATAVNSYGGGPVTFVSQHTCSCDRFLSFLFVNQEDQMIYLHYPNIDGFRPMQMTFDKNKMYADGVYDSMRNRVIYVCEDHTNPNNITQSLVSLDLDTRVLVTLESEFDFYMNPRLSPDGRKLAYIAWNFPRMSWDESQLYLVDLDRRGNFTQKRKISFKNESVQDPQFDGQLILNCLNILDLYFISDRIYKFWTVFRYDLIKNEIIDSIPPFLYHFKEIGVPSWTLGMHTFAVLPNSRVIAKSFGYLIDYSFVTKRIQLYNNQFSQVKFISYSRLNKAMTIIGSSTRQLQTLVRISNFDHHELSFHRLLNDQISIDSQYISEPMEIQYDTSNGGKSYGFYYPPKNPRFENSVLSGEKPPLLVRTHGGPTGYDSAQLLPNIMFWTSRGIGVLDINYRGSSQYGRDYRQLLNGKWGIYDVDDSCSGAQYLVDQGLVDGNRLLIDGQSSGGYTTLAALTFKKMFQAGCSFFGIGDLVQLTTKTDRLELTYVSTLIGGEQNLIDRSPIYHVDQLDVPVAFFHGINDPVVPYNQSIQMYNELIYRNKPTLIELYPGEQHGFAQDKNIIRSLEGEYYFFSRVLNFEPSLKLIPTIDVRGAIFTRIIASIYSLISTNIK